MSSAESSRKLRHFGLLSQQKRVRHIQSISLKNLSTDRALLEDDAPENVYFVLLRPGDETGFYSSERVQDIVNPSWNNLDLGNICKTHYGSLLCVIVQIWGSNANGSRILVEWTVHLRGLIHVGEELAKDSKKFQPDSIVFGLLDSFYTAGDCLPVSALGNNAKFCHALEVEQTMVSATYDVYSIARLHTMQRAIKQSEASFSGAHKSIMGKLTAQEKKTDLKAEKDDLIFRIDLLREELEKQRLEHKDERKICSEFRDKSLQQKSESSKRSEVLQRSGRKLQDHLEHLSSIRDKQGEVKSDYFSRRSTLIKELAAIYPLDVDSDNLYYINGIRLPNAEKYSGCDDTQIAIALGHTCQLVLMIAIFLQMPLRYPMVHLGSKSIIRDHITAHLSQKDRDFPLYIKGRDKMHFNYAVYLLNRNIVQVRTAVRLSTQDLRATLPNLKDLLEQKWGVRRMSEPALTNSPVTGRATSNHTMDVPSPNPTRPLPSNPPQYTETQVDPSFPRSPPPPYEANFTQQQVSGSIAGDPLSVSTVVVEASTPEGASNAQREFTSLNNTEEEEEVKGHKGRTELDIGNADTTELVSGANGGHERGATESAIENNDRDGDANGYHSDRDKQNSTKAIEDETIPGDSEGAATSLAINHIVEPDDSSQSHSHPKSSVHVRNDDTIHKGGSHPLEDESYRENFHEEALNISEAALNDAGFSQFTDDINSRTEALSNRGRFSSFNKTQSNVTS